MKSIKVTAGTSYDIFIGRDILQKLGEYLSQFSPNTKAMLMSDSCVYKLYGKRIEQVLKGLDIGYTVFLTEPGEQSKCPENYIQALRTAARSGLTRTDIVIALGGGVVGDLAGFVAATYQRGIYFIQLPTTLLAMVDSSVGGKTAIDIPEGKNLVGSFYQPSLVICNTDMLDTLPEYIVIDGLAEVLKYAILFDKELWRELSAKRELSYNTIVERCIAHKRDIVQKDEREKGERALLNLGHTIGHAVELASGFSISHGRAVAIGMAYIAYIASAEYDLSKDELAELVKVLLRYGYDLQLPYPAEKIAEGITADKKRSANNITLVLPEKIGRCYLKRVTVSEFCRQILTHEASYKKFISELDKGGAARCL